MKNTSKKLYLSLLLALSSGAHGTVIMLEDFEDSSVNYTTDLTEFSDGSNDYYGKVGVNITDSPSVPYSNISGSGYFAAEDIDDGGRQNNFATQTYNVTITGYANLTFSGLFAAGGNDGIPGYDNTGASSDDFLRVTAQIDGGTVENLFWMSAASGTNQSLYVDNDFNGVGAGVLDVLATSSFAAQNVQNRVITGTGSTLTLRVYAQSGDGSGELAWDNISVSGDLVPEPSTFTLFALGALGVLSHRRRA